MQVATIVMLMLVAMAGVVFFLLPSKRKKRAEPLKPISTHARKRKPRKRRSSTAH
ncbi:hypothetical protein [Ferrimonas pelagia]|uniref:LPXTG cell wall anchor domain-containing protein n=1 Tax=Ferrimonas pelagia TaxID=1177826 RepID=A0ABP9EVN1_9GAMM